MKDNNIYEELIKQIQSSQHSFSKIYNEQQELLHHDEIYHHENKEIKTSYFDNIIKKIQYSAGARKILKLDISNCYDSIYTHCFPAIILGVDEAQRQYNKDEKKFKKNKYCKLDILVRHQNNNQTKGILCGIITSRILSEALLVKIDNELASKKINFVRYVDDYEVFIYNDEEKVIISNFNEILSKYKLQLNYEKIDIISFPYYVDNNFEEILNKNILLDSKTIFKFFTIFYNFENQGIRGATKFLLKYLENAKIYGQESKKLFCSYLLTTMSNDERALFNACKNLINFKENLKKEQIKILKNLLKKHIKYGNDLEVIWLVYTLIMLDKFSLKLVPYILNSQNELAITLLVEKDLVSKSEIENYNVTSWLLAYQLFYRDIMSEDKFKIIVGDIFPFYKFLKENKFSFIQLNCDETDEDVL